MHTKRLVDSEASAKNIQIEMCSQYNLIDERLSKLFIGRAEDEFNKKSFRHGFIKCVIIIMQLKDHVQKEHVSIWSRPESNLVMDPWKSSFSVQ